MQKLEPVLSRPGGKGGHQSILDFTVKQQHVTPNKTRQNENIENIAGIMASTEEADYHSMSRESPVGVGGERDLYVDSEDEGTEDMADEGTDNMADDGDYAFRSPAGTLMQELAR